VPYAPVIDTRYKEDGNLFVIDHTSFPPPIMSSDDLPLPYGWIREFDPKSNHPFWVRSYVLGLNFLRQHPLLISALQVDTKADPPRAIWTHPYDDEQYLREHPDVREKVESLARQQQDSKDSPSSNSRRHSFNGHDSASMVPENDAANPNSSKKGKEKRGFFGKLKDKAIGTKEEREAYKKEQARVNTTMFPVSFSSESVSG
jgi:hypothetical protein